jgi:hypothetical protein
MSSGQLLQTGLQSKSDQFGTVFKDESGLLILLAHVKSILQPTVQIISTRIVYSLPESKVAQCPDYHLWHQRFCHPSNCVLSHVEDACIDGPKVNPPSKTLVCLGCAQGKMHQKPFHQNPKHATEVIEHVHSDLFELPVMSYHKFKWVMTLLDDYSSFAHVVLLRSKSEAASKMVELLTMLMNQCRKHVKHITSDRGGEFVSEELQKFFHTNGIQWTPSAPHIPQQNRCAERLNWMLHEKAQAICSSACIPDSWWDFAINTATHVYNRTPMSHLHWSSPYELFKGMKPKVDHFRVFGCTAYMYLPDMMHPINCQLRQS